jgi:hypothetical protein
MFGSKFVALKTATKMLRGLRYKLPMMGIPIDGPTYIYCDNNLVDINSSSPVSTLKEKLKSIAYHCVHESVARDEQQVTYKYTHTNLADLLKNKARVGLSLGLSLVRGMFKYGWPAISLITFLIAL